MFKNWFLIAGVSCGVGFGSTFLISRNLQQSAWAGLGTVPAVAASLTILSRQRQEEIDRQVAKSRLSLDGLQREELLVKEKLQLNESSCRKISAHGQKLQTAFTQLKQDVNRYREEQAGLEREINSLVLQRQAQESSLVRLDATVVTRQNNLQTTQAKLVLIQTQRRSAIDSVKQSNLKLQSICEEIRQYSATKKQLEVQLSDLQNQAQSLQTQLVDREIDLRGIEYHILQMEERRDRVSIAIVDLDRSLKQKQSLLHNIDRDRQQQQALIQEISDLLLEKQDREVLVGELVVNITVKQNILFELDAEVSEGQANLDRISIDLVQIEAQRQSTIDLAQQSELTLANIQEEISNHCINKEKIAAEIADLQNRGENLESEIVRQKINRIELQEQISALKEQQERLSIEIEAQQQSSNPEQIIDLDLGNQSKDLDKAKDGSEEIENTRQHRNCRSLYSSHKLIDRRQDFMNPQYTKKIWQEQILPFWLDRDKPKSHRFLGHVNIPRGQSDELITLVGENLRRLNRITEREIRVFDSLEQDWIKIFTFAASEYAYYYSDERFWEGLCERWKIPLNQTVENTLRQLTRKGINLLGLVETSGGYTYVSTLWLQSCIPSQNLEQFAQLLKELADRYKWEYLAEDSVENLSEKILYLYNRKYPQGGTLSHLFKYREPISGRIIQGIAKIARELEINKLSPTILEDERQRDSILGNLSLDDGFFLRDWEAIVKILTPKENNSRRQNTEIKETDLVLHLDIEDSGNIQSILPEQSIWDDEWENLRGSDCKIPEAGWEGNIPMQGSLEIPELTIDIDRVSQEYIVSLKNDRGDSIYKWSCEEIYEELPCLIFDAFSGEYLPFNLDNPTIIGVEQIICFTPKEITIVFDEGIQSIDNCIPCSLKGWKGIEMRLSGASGCISIQSDDKTIDSPQKRLCQRTINWQLQENDTPRLIGIKSNWRKSIYLEVPTLWLPPVQELSTVELKIQDADSNNELCSNIYTLLANSKWFERSLEQWIDKPGNYRVSISSDRMNWSQKFTVIEKYSISVVSEIPKPQIHIKDRIVAVENLPLSYESSPEFDAQIIEIRGLWNLEQVSLIMTNGTDGDICHYTQADREGNFKISLSELSEFWDNSVDYYSLSYQRYGYDRQPLIEAKLSLNKLEWLWVDRELTISGLKPDRPYDLSCWNLLLPNREARRLPLPLATNEQDTLPIDINLPTGIYYIRLLNAQENVEAKLGFHCIGGKNDLPEAALDDEYLENYCYTILGDESTEDFRNAAKRLGICFDIDLVKGGIDSLMTSDNHLLPEWLDKQRLISKLDTLVDLN
jgi:hypothetical protein